jgi:hypothetical protein
MRLVGFHGLTMASMKMMAFWQLIALIMEVVPCTSEMLVYFTETTQCYIPEGCHLQNVTSFDFYRNDKKMLHQSIIIFCIFVRIRSTAGLLRTHYFSCRLSSFLKGTTKYED